MYIQNFHYGCIGCEGGNDGPYAYIFRFIAFTHHYGIQLILVKGFSYFQCVNMAQDIEIYRLLVYTIKIESPAKSILNKSDPFVCGSFLPNQKFTLMADMVTITDAKRRKGTRRIGAVEFLPAEFLCMTSLVLGVIQSASKLDGIVKKHWLFHTLQLFGPIFAYDIHYKKTSSQSSHFCVATLVCSQSAGSLPGGDGRTTDRFTTQWGACVNEKSMLISFEI